MITIPYYDNTPVKNYCRQLFGTNLPATACASKKPEDGGNSGGHGKQNFK